MMYDIVVLMLLNELLFCFYLSIAITFLALDFYIEYACAS